MYGNGWPGPTASGVRIGKTSCSNRSPSSSSSAFVQSSTCPTMIPASSSATLSSRFQSFDWRAESWSTCSRTSLSVSCGLRASGDVTATPASIWSSRPATRTMKNSSRLREKIEQKRVRSSGGKDGSAATARTREFQASHDSSRLRSSSGLTPVRGVDAVVAKRISKRFERSEWVKKWRTTGERGPSGRPRRRPLGLREKTRPRRWEGRSARAYRLRRGGPAAVRPAYEHRTFSPSAADCAPRSRRASSRRPSPRAARRAGTPRDRGRGRSGRRSGREAACRGPARRLQARPD